MVSMDIELGWLISIASNEYFDRYKAHDEGKYSAVWLTKDRTEYYNTMAPHNQSLVLEYYPNHTENKLDSMELDIL